MLYKDYLFKDFLYNFRYIFNIPKYDNILYNWEDQIYRDFMIELLQQLEPRFEDKGTILFRELEEV